MIQLLEYLCDARKLLTTSHHQELVARKYCIYPSFEKKVRTMLEELASDEFLFGNNLADKIKSVKNIEKVGLELKQKPA